MTLRKYYENHIKESFSEYNFNHEAYSPMKELCQIMGDILDNSIHKQENALLTFQQDMLTEFQDSNKLRIYPVFLNDLINALQIELLAHWVTPWAEIKIAANALQAPPAGPGFPVSLLFTAPLPIGPAIAGANIPFSKGDDIINYFNTKALFYKYQYVQKFAGAIADYCNELYQKYSATGPKPYNPL